MKKGSWMAGCGVMFLLFVFSFLLQVSGRLCHAGEARGVTDNTIKIGAFVDQTGPAASVGVPAAEGSRMYFRHINDQGGINGRKVEFFLEDDHYTIPGAISAFKKLIFKDKVLSILISGGTGQVTALARHYEKEKVPVITASLAETMTNPLKRYIFTPSASYDDGVKVIIDYIMKDLKAKNPKIAIVHPDNEFGKAGLRATEKYLKKYNLKLISREIIAFGAIDATSQVLSLKRAKADYIILHEGSAAIVAFLKGAKNYGLKSKVLGSFYVSSEETISIARNACEGLLAVSPYTYWFDKNPGIVQLRKIVKKYQPMTKPKARNFTQGWLTSVICAEGLRRAGRDLTPDTLVDAYETFQNFNTGGITSPVSYSKDNHKGGNGNKIFKTDVENERFIPITEFREPTIKD